MYRYSLFLYKIIGYYQANYILKFYVELMVTSFFLLSSLFNHWEHTVSPSCLIHFLTLILLTNQKLKLLKVIFQFHQHLRTPTGDCIFLFITVYRLEESYQSVTSLKRLQKYVTYQQEQDNQSTRLQGPGSPHGLFSSTFQHALPCYCSRLTKSKQRENKNS